MVMDFFRGSTDAGLEAIEQKLVKMLLDGRKVFDTSSGTLLEGRSPAEANDEVRGTDRAINQMEQEVRRELVVHASVHGKLDLPSVLTYMSVVKDAERIGDYAKNILDLAQYGADFRGAPDEEELERYRAAVSQLIQDAADVFSDRDVPSAGKLLTKADGFLDEYDERVQRAFDYQGRAGEAVARALYYRYLKRITAHVMNMMSALVMPVDRIDYYDEDKEDRR